VAAREIVADDSPNAWASACVGERGPAHRMRVVGYVRGSRRDGLPCDRPLSVVCRDCPAVSVISCQNHRASKCGPCSARYGRRVTRLVDDGLNRHMRAGWDVGMLTITAPGENEHQGVNFVGGPRPAGVCPCTSQLADRGLWNATAGRRWNHLRTLLRREYPGLEFFRAVEFQVRGLIHLHVIVASRMPLDLNLIRSMALTAGFGCSTQWQPMANPRYVAKYVTKSLDQAPDAPWASVDEHTGEVRSTACTRLRTWSSSRSWGLTMRMIQDHHRAEAAKRAAAQRDSYAEPSPLAADGGVLPPSTDSG
jgi:hypothetical protein